MIKRTLYFGNPTYLSYSNGQLVVTLPEVETNPVLSPKFKKENKATVPVEDIGMVVLDNDRITITQPLLTALVENNAAVLSCDSRHMPLGLFLPLAHNVTQTERIRIQLESSLPLRKQMWQQTIIAKIQNQAYVLKSVRNAEVGNMIAWAKDVKSDDGDNLEARAAVYYWQNAFPMIEGFTRDRDEFAPNNWLNYGYAILRAVVARALVASGLLPTIGIHHRNKYNAYCLADDIMEPYRPFVDRVVMRMYDRHPEREEMTKEEKIELLQIPTLDVYIEGKRSPLMVAVAQTTASVYKCFSGEIRKIIYPTFE